VSEHEIEYRVTWRSHDLDGTVDHRGAVGEASGQNQVYESTCHEGNYGLLGVLANTRAAEPLFPAGEGPDPARQDNATGGGGN
jgi:hypothetical protein